MMNFVDGILTGFRSEFNRRATWEWFVVIVIGLMVRTDNLGVTSVIRGLALDPSLYVPMLNFFRSTAWSIESMMPIWWGLLRSHAPLVFEDNAVVLIGDGMKQPKEGRKIPGAKKMHQESDNSSKAEYIWGHMFGGIGVLASVGMKNFCIPMALLLQDGVKCIFGWQEQPQRQESHVVEMIKLAFKPARAFGKAILLLDRLFLTVPALERLDELNAAGTVLQIITKAKSNCTAFLDPPVKAKASRGRPPKKGKSVKVFGFFKSKASQFKTGTVEMYGKLETIRYMHTDLLWGQKLYKRIRFVLVEYDGKKAVLASTDLTIDPLRIIYLYSKRFGIECMFREMKQVVNAFGYHFWSKSMPKMSKWRKKSDPNPMDEIKTKHAQDNILKTVKAIEGFVFCAIVATGIMQMISFKFSGTKELSKIRYLRTISKSIVSEATVADFFRKNILWLLGKSTNLTISRLIMSKQIAYDEVDKCDLAG